MVLYIYRRDREREKKIMNKTYERILRRLERLQDNLMEIEDYDEDAYQALQQAVDFFENELDGE